VAKIAFKVSEAQNDVSQASVSVRNHDGLNDRTIVGDGDGGSVAVAQPEEPDGRARRVVSKWNFFHESSFGTLASQSDWRIGKAISAWLPYETAAQLRLAHGDDSSISRKWCAMIRKLLPLCGTRSINA
jgi:hypothetical protein